MTLTQDHVVQLETIFGAERVQRNKNISPYLTMRTQVEAEFYIEVRTREEWLSLAKLLVKKEFPFLLMGGGSNIAIVTGIINGLVIKNAYQKKEVINETDEYSDMRVSSGYSVTRLAKETAEMGLSGFEYHLGLPGTLGGGIFMNSKWTRPDAYLGDSLITATLLDDQGHEKVVDQDYFEFSYGYSNLQKTKEIFLEGTFRLRKMDSQELIKRTKESMEHRHATQPAAQYTTGCFFKNISEREQQEHNLPTKSAGYLIDKAGMKGTQVGDFYISDKHANFIMNKGQGKPEDLKMLVEQIKEKIKKVYGIELREEVIIYTDAIPEA